MRFLEEEIKNKYYIMIYIYGDSHANFNFKNLILPHKNYYHNSITMHRIGRDNIIINFNRSQINEKDTIVMVYGEVDCRCHIHRQIKLGKEEDAVIYELVSNYFITIQNNVPLYTKVIIVGIVPPTYRPNEETSDDDPTRILPIIGTNEERVRYTYKVNQLLQEMANIYNYVYFNPHSYYTSSEGTIKPELSDNCVHIGNNTYLLEKFVELYEKINQPEQEPIIFSPIPKKMNMMFG